MTDSQNEFAYSQMRDLVNKSIKSNVIDDLVPSVASTQGQGHPVPAQAHRSGAQPNRNLARNGNRL